MRYYDFDDNVFFDISYNDNPSLVKNVSMLRHYINCHGVTDSLVKHFNTDIDTVCNIAEYCFGAMSVKEIIKTPKLIDDCIEDRRKKEEALRKNAELICQLSEKRRDFCCLGTRGIKLLLNKLAKNGDKVAEMYRTALEAEDENIKAKDNWFYADAHYKKKRELIAHLISLCKECDVMFGIQDSDIQDTSHIIYFELPECEQISFHNTFDKEELKSIPEYNKEWDGLKNSTLPKLEQGILNCYATEIKEKIDQQKKKATKKNNVQQKSDGGIQVQF